MIVSNGTVTPAGPSPQPSSVPAAAQTLMANMKLAAMVGVAAKKSGGANFVVPVLLTPVGTGTAVSANLSMNAKSGGNVTAYTGTVDGSTTTVLPSGGADAQQLVKAAGVGAVTHGFTPAGRIAAAAAAHRRQAQQKEAEKSGVPDAMSLTVTASFGNGRLREIGGQQTDAVSTGGKPVKIYSTWSFTLAKR